MLLSKTEEKKDLKVHNEKCADCKWFRYCCGGCRAIGLALTEDVFGSDQSKCLFFEGHYWHKIDSALSGCYSAYKQILENEN